MMAGLITVSACGGGEAPAPEAAPEAEEPMADMAEAEAEMEMDMAPRVFFTAPEEGATASLCPTYAGSKAVPLLPSRVRRNL